MIHVGNVSNKGTQGLLKSDISTIRAVVAGDVVFSVSTTDGEGVKRLNLALDGIVPPTVDIPYERADLAAKKFGFGRESWTYKVFALGSLFFMFVQALFSLFSVVLVKAGLGAFYRRQGLEHLRNADVVISYSDENFKESASLLPLNLYWILTWWSMLVSRTWEILLAKSLRKPVVLFPNSVGPFRTWIGRFLSRLALNSCNYVLIREPISYEIANALGLQSARVLTSDTTLLLESPDAHPLNVPSSPLIGISAGFYSHSLSEKEFHQYINAHAAALDRAVETYGVFVVFLPHYTSGFKHDDLEICRLIFAQMENQHAARIVNVDQVEEFRSLLGQMDLVVSSKMHPAVLAVSRCVPTLCIAYDHKQIGFFKQLDLSTCLLHFHDVSDERLSAKIDEMWRGRDEIRASLRVRVPQLQQDVKQAIRHALGQFAPVR